MPTISLVWSCFLAYKYEAYIRPHMPTAAIAIAPPSVPLAYSSSTGPAGGVGSDEGFFFLDNGGDVGNRK